MRTFKFTRLYAVLAAILFGVEVLIALYVHDQIIRPYVGDFLVVMLMYCFVKAFFNVPVLPTALLVLSFAYIIETLQYINIVTLLGLQSSAFARTIIGTSFEWTDLIAYTLGIAAVLYLEKKFGKNGTVGGLASKSK